MNLGLNRRKPKIKWYYEKPWRFNLGLIALLDLYLSKSCGYGPLTNLNTKQPPMF